MVRLLPHPIYMEWLVCFITFGIVALVDKKKICNVNHESYNPEAVEENLSLAAKNA